MYVEGKSWREFIDLLNITSSQASFVLNDLKLHRGTRPDGAITLPRKSGKVKEHIVA
jgi:hypothetical protein